MSNPILLLLTDTHLKKGNEVLIKSIFEDAIKICKEKKIGLAFLGDFFTSREAQTLETLLHAKDILTFLQKSGVKCYFISGNHDKTNLNDDKSYLDAFPIWDNTTMFLFTNKLMYIGGCLIHFLSYYKESDGTFVEKLNSEKETRIDFLLTHIAVTGVKNNDGSKVVNNLSPKKTFAKYNKVFTGHYHDHSTFDNIVYIGSTHQANHAEDLDKGYTILNDDGSYEQIKSNFPYYVTIEVGSDVSSSEVQIKESLKAVLDGLRTHEITSLRVLFNEQTNTLKREINDAVIDFVNKNYSNVEKIKIQKKSSSFYLENDEEGDGETAEQEEHIEISDVLNNFKSPTPQDLKIKMQNFYNVYTDIKGVESENLKKILFDV